jgi:hypothetical protein
MGGWPNLAGQSDDPGNGTAAIRGRGSAGWRMGDVVTGAIVGLGWRARNEGPHAAAAVAAETHISPAPAYLRCLRPPTPTPPPPAASNLQPTSKMPLSLAIVPTTDVLTMYGSQDTEYVASIRAYVTV